MLGTELVDRISSLLENKKVSNKTFLEDIDLAPNSFTKWRSGQTPNCETIIKISNYLNVTTDYLLTGQSELPPELSQLIEDYQSLDVKYQNLIKTNIELLK